MIINKLELENFRSHKDTKIDFNQGISLILGDNGAGKSSILEAISFALFGKINTTLDDAIRKAADDEDQIEKMSVKLVFSHNGKTYQIIRSRKNKTSVELKEKIDDKFRLHSRTTKNVNESILSILNIDYESFQNAVYIKQGEITDLIDAKPAEKKKLISKLLNIESLEKAYEEIQKIIKKYEDKQNENKGTLKTCDEVKENRKNKHEELEEIKTKLSYKKKEKEKYNKNLESYRQEQERQKTDKSQNEEFENEKEKKKAIINQQNQILEKYRQEINEITQKEEKIKEIEKKVKPLSEFKELEKIHQKIGQYKKDAKTQSNKIKTINDEIKTLRETEKDHQTYLRLGEELEKIDEQRQYLEEKDKQLSITKEKYETNKNKSEKLRKEIGDELFKYSKYSRILNKVSDLDNYIEEEKEKLNKNITQTTKNITEYEKQISARETEIKSKTKSLKDLKATTGKCPICQSNISDEKHKQLRESYENEIKKKNEEIKKTEEQKRISEEENKNSEKQLEEINKIQIALLYSKEEEYYELEDEIKKQEEENIVDNYNKLQQDLTGIKKKFKTKKDMKENLKENNQTYERAEYYLENLERPIEEEEKEYEVIKKQIETCKKQMIQIQQTTRIPEDLLQTIEYLEDQEKELNSLQGEVKSKANKIKDKKELEIKIDENKKELRKIENKLKDLNFNIGEYNKIEENILNTQDIIHQLDKEIVKFESEIDLTKKALKEMDNTLEKLDKVQREQNQLEDYVKLLEYIRQAYSKDGAQSDLRNAVKPQIELNTMSIFQEFGFEYTSVNLDQDYAITVNINEEELNLNQLSGGEKIVIALALRLAIAKTITQGNTELLILDEPTIHLDVERRSRLIEIIREINIVPQILVVTHDNEMESLSNNIIKISKNRGISNIDLE